MHSLNPQASGYRLLKGAHTRTLSQRLHFGATGALKGMFKLLNHSVNLNNLEIRIIIITARIDYSS